jgi:ABC-type lipoprotein release transport system permease subunit
MSLQNGMMKSRVRAVIDTETGHLQIHHPEFKRDYDPGFFMAPAVIHPDTIRSWPTVKSVTIRSVTQAMLSTTAGSTGIQVNGVIPETEVEVSGLNKKIGEGTGFTGKRKNDILIGRKLADKMKLKLGSRLVLTFTDTADCLVAGAFRIAGIYETVNGPMDERNAYVHIRDLNELLGTGDAFHEIVILLHVDDNMAAVGQALKSRYPGWKIESWKEISPETELMVNTLDYYIYIIIGIIMLALAFGIINTMMMAILERTREIGMMLALGMNRYKLYALLLLETFFLTITGTPFGILLGWVVTKFFAGRGINIAAVAGEAMSSFGFSSMVYPVFPYEQLPEIMLIVLMTALVAAILPVMKSVRLQPVEALRK